MNGSKSNQGFDLVESYMVSTCKIQKTKYKMQNAKYKIQNAKCKIQNAREIELHSLFWLDSLCQLWQSITLIVHLLVIRSLLLRIEVCLVPAIHNLCFHKKYIFFIICSHSFRHIVCCCKPYFDNFELSYQIKNIIKFILQWIE